MLHGRESYGALGYTFCGGGIHAAATLVLKRRRKTLVDKAHWRRLEHTGTAVLLCAAAAGWIYVAVNQHRQKDLVVIVKKHFMFYPEYSHGAWREGPCTQPASPASGTDAKDCRDVTYTTPVKGCGTVTFDWSVVPGNDDADATWTYNGARPKFAEAEYPLYAFLDEEGRFIDSPALGKPVPEACRVE